MLGLDFGRAQALLFAMVLAACGGGSASAPGTPAVPVPPLPLGVDAFAWSKPSDLNAGLPVGIEVFRGSGGGLRAVYAKLDASKNAGIEWDVAYKAGGQTPSQFAANASKKPWVVINAGYFDTGASKQSYSLAVSGGTLLSAGAKQLNRNGQNYFPTRAAFGALADGTSQTVWSYPVGASNVLYQYPLPSPVNTAQAPLAQPDATFQSGGMAWAPIKAIGGGPMLLKAGATAATEAVELIDSASGIGPSTPNPRTAVARLSDGSVVYLVVDGRSVLSTGVSLDALRDMLTKLGAVDAINLDGGGSSVMVVNGVVANAPSDGAERAVPTALVFQNK